MITALLIYRASSGALFISYIGLKIVRPAAVDFVKSSDIDNIQNGGDLTADQTKAIEDSTLEGMRNVNWWLWWPLFSVVAWCITSLFLGFMKVVKFNECFVILTYLPSLIWRRNDWSPPNSIMIEVLTIIISLAVVNLLGRWICSKRTRT